MRGVPVSKLISDSIPKDGKLCENVDKLLELGMQEDWKVKRILELVQQVVSKKNNLEDVLKEVIKKRKFVEGQHTDSVEGEEEEEVFDEDYAAAYGTPGRSVEEVEPQIPRVRFLAV
ncbi:hypothetical protein L1987_18003 [Smallanthus sonchifolius]|uniref:Uncharacterized protein n=1 Tax=Smallanthus sonchifolius TaxID=185202 RepID=A0ACB9J013_9ASTR|nr:hypothetical protein L1987_18003 [Smallanthus sonchifolius]